MNLFNFSQGDRGDRGPRGISGSPGPVGPPGAKVHLNTVFPNVQKCRRLAKITQYFHLLVSWLVFAMIKK